MAQQSGKRVVAKNPKAYHDYFIEDTYEAGSPWRVQRSNPSA